MSIFAATVELADEAADAVDLRDAIASAIILTRGMPAGIVEAAAFGWALLPARRAYQAEFARITSGMTPTHEAPRNAFGYAHPPAKIRAAVSGRGATP